MRIKGQTLFLSIILNLHLASPSPQIFTDSQTYSSCKLNYHGKDQSLPDKLWTISNREITLHFSFCQTPQPPCHNHPSCLLNKPTNTFTPFGGFSFDDSDDFTLVSSAPQCPSDPRRPLTLKITLECSDRTRPKPQIVPTDDECLYEVTMLKPGCRPKCTEIIDGSHLLDVRNFPKNVMVASDSKNFSFSVCGWNRLCSGDVSACEIIEGAVVPLASLESQYLNYDVGKNELTARGRFKDGRVLRDIQVLIKCRWDTVLGETKYKKPSTQGRHYKFEVESSFGCIKLPQKCTTRSVDNLNFDLTKLNRAQGWQLVGVPEGTITLNICGLLDNPPRTTCSDQYSQVCHQTNTHYINRGTLLSSLIAHDDVIDAIFVSGSTCTENPRTSHSTRIEFRCSKTERGPIFHEIADCVLFVVWETPHACPVDYYTGDNCHVNDRISNRNLQQLYSATDKQFVLTADGHSQLVYNLCGPLHRNCSGFDNASFCFVKNNVESVAAWDSRQLVSDSGQLRQELQGHWCQNAQKKSKVGVTYVCTYEATPPPPQIRVIEDGCVFDMTVHTRWACASQTPFKECVYSAANVTYDLSPLSLKNDNHVVSVNDVDFVFNLCGPVVTRPGALCRGDTSFCWNNKSEVNVKHKFMSVGGVEAPRMRGNALVVEGAMGSYCEGLGYYKSVIEFQCSQQKFDPVFVAKDECVYNFRWLVPEACPIAQNCIVEGSKGDTRLDLTQLQKKTVHINVDNATNKYEFHLCSDTYIHYTNGTETANALTRQYFIDNNQPHLVLNLNKDCSNSSTISKVFFEMECSPNIDDHFKQTSFDNCVLNMTIATRFMCPMETKESPQRITEEEKTTPTPQPIKNCSIVNPYNGYDFDLKLLKLEEAYQKMCPSVFFNYSGHAINLAYSTGIGCNMDVILRCTETPGGAVVVKDGACVKVIAYDLPEACSLLKQDIIVAGGHTAVIAGSVISIIAVGCILCIYLNRKRLRNVRDIPMFRSKEAVPIYTRDCNL